MREIICCLGIGAIISIALILAKIFGILLWSWLSVLLIVFLLVPFNAILIAVLILSIIYTNTK